MIFESEVVEPLSRCAFFSFSAMTFVGIFVHILERVYRISSSDETKRGADYLRELREAVKTYAAIMNACNWTINSEVKFTTKAEPEASDPAHIVFAILIATKS